LNNSPAFAGEERILDWEGSYNTRDTGGLPTADGGQIRPGALVRSDVLTRLTPNGRAALVAHGVRTIVDVRTSEEIARDVDYPFRDNRAEAEPDYINVSFVVDLDGEQRATVQATRESAKRLEELNRLDLEIHRAGIGAVVGAVADARPGGVLVHCYAGKDRTGMTIALMLAIAGVSDEDIADDYALTMLNLEPLIAEWLDTIEDRDERERMRGLATPRREVMLDTLAHVKERYGGAESYLAGAAVSSEQLARIRDRLVDRPDDRKGPLGEGAARGENAAHG
jgi:protein-tyrosine phosphatase